MNIIKLSAVPKLSHKLLMTFSPNEKLVLSAIFAALSAILQAAGGFLPGVGFLLSPFSTMTILLATIISLKYGFFTYLLTIILLLFVAPSELLIFPFLTGLMGLGIGSGLYTQKKGLTVIIISEFLLFIGLCFLLYVINFPVLGPFVPIVPSIPSILIILCFAFFYSWLWLELSIYFLNITYNLLIKITK